MLLIISILSGSCKKDTENRENQNFRFTKKTLYSHDTLWSSATYFYTDSLITTVKYYYNSAGRGDSVKTEFEYRDENTIIQESFFWYGALWYPVEKYIIEKLDRKIIKTQTFNIDGSFWDPISSEEYNYEGDNLTEEIWNKHEYGVWSQDTRITYDYSGNLLTNIAACYNFGSVWDTVGLYSFTYDPYGNLESEAFEGDVLSRKIEYVYEKGQGNYAQMLSPGGGLISYRCYPSPTSRNRSANSSLSDPRILESMRMKGLAW
jgi:hypothetical protein